MAKKDYALPLLSLSFGGTGKDPWLVDISGDEFRFLRKAKAKTKEGMNRMPDAREDLKSIIRILKEEEGLYVTFVRAYRGLKVPTHILRENLRIENL